MREGMRRKPGQRCVNRLTRRKGQKQRTKRGLWFLRGALLRLARGGDFERAGLRPARLRGVILRDDGDRRRGGDFLGRRLAMHEEGGESVWGSIGQ